MIVRLKKGVARTSNLIARATEYHGGPTTTEYLLTADIAREFIEANYETHVEFLIRKFVNGITALHPQPSLPRLKGKRTDVVLAYTELIPIAVIEIKIGVASLNGIRVDLDKIIDLFRRLNDGISASDEDNDGHATRYYAVIIRDLRVPKPVKTPTDMKNRNRH